MMSAVRDLGPRAVDAYREWPARKLKLERNTRLVGALRRLRPGTDSPDNAILRVLRYMLRSPRLLTNGLMTSFGAVAVWRLIFRVLSLERPPSFALLVGPSDLFGSPRGRALGTLVSSETWLS